MKTENLTKATLSIITGGTPCKCGIVGEINFTSTNRATIQDCYALCCLQKRTSSYSFGEGKNEFYQVCSAGKPSKRSSNPSAAISGISSIDFDISDCSIL